MAGEKHLYLVVGGGYASGATALAAEEWQFGLRLLAGPGAEPDPVGSIANNWDVVAANINRTETAWTISGNWTVEGGANDLQPDDYLNDQVAPAVEAFIETSSLFSLNVQLRTLRLYPIGAPDGKVVAAPPYLQGSPILLTWTGTLPVGGTSGAMMAPDSSCVASLRTAQVGRRGRGRIYPPALAAGAMGTSGEGGTVSSTTRGVLRDAMVTLLEDIQISTAADGFDVRPMVTGAPFTQYALINAVRVGNVLDHQTRRRKSIVESYVTATVDNPT